MEWKSNYENLFEKFGNFLFGRYSSVSTLGMNFKMVLKMFFLKSLLKFSVFNKILICTSAAFQCAPQLPVITSSIQASPTICVHSACHLTPWHLKDVMPLQNVRTRLPSLPPKNLLPYPLKGRCTEQGDRSSPVIPFYPSGFSNKCALQAFNLWPLHLRTTVM